MNAPLLLRREVEVGCVLEDIVWDAVERRYSLLLSREMWDGVDELEEGGRDDEEEQDGRAALERHGEATEIGEREERRVGGKLAVLFRKNDAFRASVSCVGRRRDGGKLRLRLTANATKAHSAQRRRAARGKRTMPRPEGCIWRDAGPLFAEYGAVTGQYSQQHEQPHPHRTETDAGAASCPPAQRAGPLLRLDQPAPCRLWLTALGRQGCRARQPLEGDGHEWRSDKAAHRWRMGQLDDQRLD